MKYTLLATLTFLAACGLLSSCMGSGRAMMNGGEVTGSRGATFNEPVPYGMVALGYGNAVEGNLRRRFLDGPVGSD